MAHKPTRIFEQDAEFDQTEPRHATIRHRSYEVGRHATLSDVSLQKGNTLPLDADESDGGNFEIINAQLVAQGGTNIAKVVAIKYGTE